ncbi:MAG: TIGR03564 family F420-dependent LLM class oxidoreductase [Rhodospirillaceae bacterium]|nr:TIGR03564 family F420-dependent LLM class oxidoreductase [Rhodospirillaceae bacterium]
MRIGVFVGASVADLMTLDDLLARIKQAEDDGFDSFWIPHISARGYDALAAPARRGMQPSRIELGVGVVPTYPRHPAALAQQALTTATATGGRFILGIGPSHRPGMEEGFGIPYDRPALHTREYLSVMRPLLEEGAVKFNGEFFNVNLELAALERPPCPILVSALAPQMLNLAGQLADGTVTWMAGPRTIETHITPRINRAAENTGRPAPRVTVGLPTAATDDENAGRQSAAQSYARYGELVNYRRVLDIEGVESPAEVAVIGNEASIQRQLEAFAEGGATDFVANIFDVPGETDSSQRAYDALKSLVGKI